MTAEQIQTQQRQLRDKGPEAILASKDSCETKDLKQYLRRLSCQPLAAEPRPNDTESFWTCHTRLGSTHVRKGIEHLICASLLTQRREQVEAHGFG